MADQLTNALKANPLIALRKRQATGVSDNKLVAMRMAKPDNNMAKEAEAGDNWHNQPDANSEDIRRSALMAEFNKLPFLQKFNQGMDDIVKTGLSGLSNGLYDKIAPEAADSRTRMGAAAIPIDVIAALRSPINKVIGAGANLVRPTAPGLLPALGRMAVSGGEGATIAGTESAIRNNGDLNKVKQDAEVGGGLSAATEFLFKHLIPGTGKTVATLASGVPKKTLEDTFSVAAGSKAGSNAITAIRNGKSPLALDEQIIALRQALGKTDLIPSEKAILQKTLNDIEAKFKTTSGMTALDGTDAANVKKLLEGAKDKDTGKWLLNHLDDLAAYLENTKVTKAEAITTSGRAVNDAHKVAKDLGTAIDPKFGNLMHLAETLSKARAAGTATKNWRPEKSMIGSLLQMGSLAGTPALHVLGFSPLLAAGAAAIGAGSWLTSSPKLVGKTAQTAGQTKRVLSAAVKAAGGSEPTYGQLGILPGTYDKNKRKK